MWVIFSLFAALCWAIANIIDKAILNKWVKNPFLPITVAGIIWLVLGGISYFIKGFSHLSSFDIFLAVSIGVINVFAWIFYFKAMQIQEASRVVPLSNLSQLFVVILAAIFLKEILTPLKYLGIFLLVIGAIFISVKNFRLSFGRAFWWIILAAGLYAINSILTKRLLNTTDFWTVFGYRSLGMFIGSIPIIYLFINDLLETVKQHGKKVIIAISVSELVTAFGVLLSVIAASIGYITLVNSLQAIQPFLVLLFAILLSIFFPSLLKEEVNKSTIFFKIIAIASIFMGVILVTS